jgi:opacity protein-like surface antigen
MLKNLLCGAAALGLMSQAAFANNVIINGVPQHGGGTINVPYGHSAANCCATETLPYTPLPVVSQPAPVTYTAAPATTYTSAPAVTYEAAPVTYTSAPATTYAPTTVGGEELIYIDEAPVTTAPIVATPVVSAPAPVMMAEKPAARGWSSRVYVGARGGWSGLRDTDFNIQGGPVHNEYEQRGYNVAAVVGWGAKVSNSIGYRLEAELGYQASEVESHTVGGTTFNSDAFGDTETLYGFANAYLDIPVVQRLNAVVGGGVGVGRVKFDSHGIDGVGTVMDDSDTVFGYHVDAGLSYDVTDRLALEAMYRYTSFVDVELTARDNATSETDVDSHNVVVGARYGF